MASPKNPAPEEGSADEAWEAELAEAEDTLLFTSEAPVGPLNSEAESTEVQEGQARPPAAAAPLRAIAPEVSPGIWREKAYVPRGSMAPAEVLVALRRAVQLAQMQRGEMARTWVALRAEWLPLLRHAVEQAGGDGLDAHLSRLLRPPGVPAKDPLVGELRARMRQLNHAKTITSLLEDAERTVRVVERALQEPERVSISLGVLERDLEGRLDVDVVLSILFATSGELRQRVDHVARTVESLRKELRAMPGAQPTGLFSNFARLKLEQKVIEAELLRRRLPHRAL